MEEEYYIDDLPLCNAKLGIAEATIKSQLDELDRLKGGLVSIINAHSSCRCNPDRECEVVEAGCLGDALHNEIMKATQLLTPNLKREVNE